jgi:hypothetical protein
MAVDTQALASEIQNDPLSLGYAAFVASGSDGGIVALLNTPNVAWTKRIDTVPVSTVAGWAAAGPIARIQAAANNAASPVQSVCQMAILYLQGSSTAFDFSDGGKDIQMIGAMLAAGVITQAEHDSLLALRNVSPASRAEVLWGAGVSVDQSDVSFALRGTR